MCVFAHPLGCPEGMYATMAELVEEKRNAFLLLSVFQFIAELANNSWQLVTTKMSGPIPTFFLTGMVVLGKDL